MTATFDGGQLRYVARCNYSNYFYISHVFFASDLGQVMDGSGKLVFF